MSAWADLLHDQTLAVAIDAAGCRTRWLVPDGWDTGRRILPDHLLYGIERGRVSCEHAGGRCDLGAGDLLLAPPGAAFRCRQAGAARVGLLRLRFRLARGARLVSLAEAPLAIAAGDGLLPQLAGLAAEAGQTDGWHGQRARWLLCALLASIDRHRHAPGHGRLTPAQCAAVQRAAESGIREPRGLARIAGLSHDWFARRFRATFGASPRTWLVGERIRRAAILLSEGGLGVEEVAGAAGWRDAKLFSRQFRQVMGSPPHVWRRQNAER